MSLSSSAFVKGKAMAPDSSTLTLENSMDGAAGRLQSCLWGLAGRT